MICGINKKKIIEDETYDENRRFFGISRRRQNAAFTRGFASVLSPESLVRSPTFTLVNEYRNKATKTSLFHFDMYRIDSEDDLYSMGFDDYPDRGICIAEWCEKIPYALPLHYLRVTITKNDAATPDSREILIERV